MAASMVLESNGDCEVRDHKFCCREPVRLSKDGGSGKARMEALLGRMGPGRINNLGGMCTCQQQMRCNGWGKALPSGSLAHCWTTAEPYSFGCSLCGKRGDPRVRGCWSSLIVQVGTFAGPLPYVLDFLSCF
jgi:hypothetical protein